MASVSHKIIASPFAILGSIGVVATIPNFSERLEREGIGVEEVMLCFYTSIISKYN